jgi:hypothetical protein
MKVFLMSFVGVLVVGAAGMVTYAHYHKAPSDDASALASIPTPTGGDSSSDLQGGNAPYSNAQKVETEDEKNAREQNWKADHVQPAGPGDSNVTAEDVQELNDSEKPTSNQVNRPK